MRYFNLLPLKVYYIIILVYYIITILVNFMKTESTVGIDYVENK